MFGHIKNILKNKSLKSAAACARKREELACNFEMAKTMGVIYPFNINIDTVLNAVRDVAERYNIELVFMIYFPQDKLPEGIEINSPSRIFFSDNECNWFGVPNAAAIKNFVNTRFNLLIDLSSKVWFPLQHIAISSNAGFKIGRINHETYNPYNFVLLGSENEAQFIKDLETYLYKIK
ncbi:MAG: hypothetical protein LBK96_06465 [Prevotellaceae bacterium]|jgi:hypothetical protein|nr:hypothetical protein [Prevotellaceae bacterium]